MQEIMNRASTLSRAVLCVALLLLASCTFADTSPVDSSSDMFVAEERLADAIKSAEESTQLQKEVKETLVDLYKTTSGLQKQAIAHAEAAAAFIYSRVNAPQEIDAIRKKLQALDESDTPSIQAFSDKTPVAELEQLLLFNKSALSAAETMRARMDRQLQALKQRPDAITREIADAEEERQDLNEKINLDIPADQLPQLSEALQWQQAAQSAALNNKIEMLNQEQLSQAARMELLQTKQLLNAAETRQISATIKRLEERISALRQRDIAAAVEKTESDTAKAVGKHPLIQALAEKNAALSSELELISKNLEKLTEQTEEVTATAHEVDENYRLTREKVEIAGLSHVLGQVLLDHRRNLPDVKSYRKRSKMRKDLAASSGLRQIRNIEELQQLRNVDAYVEQLAATAPQDITANLKTDLERLVNIRKELLTKAIALDSKFLGKLEEADRAYQQVLDAVDGYSHFLEKHLLWVRNAPLPTIEIVQQMATQFGWLLSPALWLESLVALLSGGLEGPLPFVALLLFVLLIASAGRLRRVIEESGIPVGKPMEDHFSYTFKAITASLLLTLPWPLLMWTVGWQMGMAEHGTAFSKAVSESLQQTAYSFFYLRLFYIISLPGGLADVHFQLSKASVELLRSETKRFMLIFLPVIFITITTFRFSGVDMETGIVRASIMLTLLVLGVFFYRLMASRSAVKRLQARFARFTLPNSRLLWVSIVLLIPAALMVLTIFGYIYSAAVLISNLLQTLWLALALYILQQLAIRWLTLSHRRLAFRALIKRQQEAAAIENGVVSEAQATPHLFDDEKDYNLSALTQQSRKLLDVAFIIAAIGGLWMIWSELLPAFKLLDEITLWHYTDVIAGQEQHVAITVGTIILTIVLIIITIIAARNIPALLEIVLRQSFGMLAGNSYAITTLTKYLIATIGALVIFSNLGASWSQLQWLVAALGVGIGFGLQEIIANFICGIIILFERPIRIGDLVTVGDSSGTVTRIRIRATTIQTFDRQELLVPNKEFITGRLLNWSLSDKTLRIVITVGIAYGSDVKTAMALMLQAAQENQHILDEPEPFVAFENFGDSSLTMVLRCFLESVDERIRTISQLHEAINDKLIAAGIEIAFPQQDVHLDIREPLEVRLQGHSGSSSSGATPQHDQA
jgi:potassium-dependent mechanosensitive channel